VLPANAACDVISSVVARLQTQHASAFMAINVPTANLLIEVFSLLFVYLVVFTHNLNCNIKDFPSVFSFHHPLRNFSPDSSPK